MGKTQTTTWQHPCLSCGACCASFRVAFSKAELAKLPPYAKLQTAIVDLGGNWVAMHGTDHKHAPACKSLNGRVGKNVSCSMYSERPSPCREFTASYENGLRSERCDEARRKHGLPPLQSSNFNTNESLKNSDLL